MSDKVGWFFGPPGTYTAYPYPAPVRPLLPTAQTKEKIKLKREMICFSFCHVAPFVLTISFSSFLSFFPLPFVFLFFFLYFENIIFPMGRLVELFIVA